MILTVFLQITSSIERDEYFFQFNFLYMLLFSGPGNVFFYSIRNNKFFLTYHRLLETVYWYIIVKEIVYQSTSDRKFWNISKKITNYSMGLMTFYWHCLGPISYLNFCVVPNLLGWIRLRKLIDWVELNLVIVSKMKISYPPIPTQPLIQK